ncbi:hypothetical protein BH09BAC6_BH09BAC6_04890 [soil metagenome]
MIKTDLTTHETGHNNIKGRNQNNIAMRNLTDQPLLQTTISPGTVFISTNPDQSSYANLVVTIQNQGSDTLSVNSIAITLPVTLAPANGLGSIAAVADQPDLWNFGPSDYTAGEFDATPQSGNDVTMNAGDTWSFELNMVTLVSTIVQSSAEVTATVTFADATSTTTPLNVDIDPAVASIISFNSTPANISPNQVAQLNWQCEEIDYCIISPIGDNQYAETGTLEVRPETTTIYTLFAYGDGVILSAQWAVSVDNAQIILFGGSEAQTSVNYGDNITLVWACNQFTVSVSMIDNTGVTIPDLMTNGNTPQNGSVSVGPITEPTTFTLTAHGDSSTNFAEQAASININNLIYTLTADPDNDIWTGDNVTLNWNIESASAVSISPAVTNGPSLQNLSGSTVVNPTQDVTYILSVSGFINDVAVDEQAPVPLTVEPVVINNFDMDPNPIIPGLDLDGGTLSWSTQAEVVSIDNGLGSQPVNGQTVIQSFPDGTVYTLTAGTQLNPSLVSQQLTAGNGAGPYTFNAMQPDQTFEYGIDLMVPSPGSMYAIQQGIDSSYVATFTGITPTGPSTPQYAALPVYLDNDPSASYFVILCWPNINIQAGFQWTDPNNQSGTITLAPMSSSDANLVWERLNDLKKKGYEFQ